MVGVTVHGGVWQCVAVVCGGMQWCVVVCEKLWWWWFVVVVCGGTWWCVVVCGKQQVGVVDLCMCGYKLPH